MLKLKKILLVLFILFLSSTAFAAVYVHGYYRKDGTYVRGHYRSDPNGIVTDNWSYKGNINPYTGKVGTNSYSSSTKSSTSTNSTATVLPSFSDSNKQNERKKSLSYSVEYDNPTYSLPSTVSDDLKKRIATAISSLSDSTNQNEMNGSETYSFAHDSYSLSQTNAEISSLQTIEVSSDEAIIQDSQIVIPSYTKTTQDNSDTNKFKYFFNVDKVSIISFISAPEITYYSKKSLFDTPIIVAGDKNSNVSAKNNTEYRMIKEVISDIVVSGSIPIENCDMDIQNPPIYSKIYRGRN